MWLTSLLLHCCAVLLAGLRVVTPQALQWFFSFSWRPAVRMSRKCGVSVAVHIRGEAPPPPPQQRQSLVVYVCGGLRTAWAQSWRCMAGQQSPSHLTLNNNRTGLLGLAPRCCWEAFSQSKVVQWHWNMFLQLTRVQASGAREALLRSFSVILCPPRCSSEASFQEVV